MVKQENLSAHVMSLSQGQWNTLFDLLPQIRASKKFGRLVGSKKTQDGSYTFPYWSEAEIVSRFFNTAYMLGLVVVFDWSAWKEGIDMLNDPDTNYTELDRETLCKLLTIVIRSDKFCEGYLINCFEQGIVTKIVEALEIQTLAIQQAVLVQF